MKVSVLNLAAVLATSANLFQVAVAQTWTDCNPTKTTCKPDPALAGTYEWKHGEGDITGFSILAGRDVIMPTDEGLVFRVEKKLDAPTIVSDWYMMFGKVEVTLKAAPGAGIISSVVLQSDDLDEIDWEWVGLETHQAQSNYFGKGNTSSYDRGGFHPVEGQSGFHKYGIEWTKDKIDWIIDDEVVRTLVPNQANGFYPQTPSQLRIGSWDAGNPDNEPGVISWAMGPTDYAKGPFDMIIADIKATDYSTGKEYVYGDKSGSWQSIVAVDGKVNAGPQTGPPNEVPKIRNPDGSYADGTFKAPTNSGLYYQSSTTTISEPTPAVGGSHDDNDDKDNIANTSETTPTPSTSQPSPSSQPHGGAGELFASPSGFVTGSPQATANSTNPHPTGKPVEQPDLDNAGLKAIPAGIALGIVGLGMGWLL